MSKVVVVEDETPLLETLASKLERRGIEVFKAKDGNQGIDLIRKIQPDLVLLDIVMPHSSGVDLLEKLRSDDQSNIPVIILSNLDQPTDLQSVQELGISEYLVKSNVSLGKVMRLVLKVMSDTAASGQQSEGESNPNQQSTLPKAA